MTKDIIKTIEKIVYDLCRSRQDYNWELHISLVVKYSKILARKFNADVEICEVSALLHDICKLNGEGKSENHHILGEKQAETILLKLNYPKNKIDKVKHCILTHSSDKNYMPKTLEAKIVASADAMSHFYNFNSMCYFIYNTKKFDINEGKEKLLKKYKKSYKKIMPKAKPFVKPQYDAIKLLLK